MNNNIINIKNKDSFEWIYDSVKVYLYENYLQKQNQNKENKLINEALTKKEIFIHPGERIKRLIFLGKQNKIKLICHELDSIDNHNDFIRKIEQELNKRVKFDTISEIFLKIYFIEKHQKYDFD